MAPVGQASACLGLNFAKRQESKEDRLKPVLLGPEASMSLNAQAMNRRSFLKASATGAAGLLIGFYFHSEAESPAAAAEAQPGTPIVFNAWIHVGTDDYVTILID